MFDPRLINNIVGFLDLEKPFRIVIKPTIDKYTAAEYISLYRKNKLIQHRITIAVSEFSDSNGRSFESLIAHEFVHAWQEEWVKERKHHGKHFIKMARALETELGLSDIYIPGIDIG